MQKIQDTINRDGLTSLELDIEVSDELYVRTRIERGQLRGRAYYFVRSGDTAERGEGACTDKAFAKICAELLALSADGAAAATTAHRLTVNDSTTTRTLSLPCLKAVTETLACHVDELALLDNFKPYEK